MTDYIYINSNLLFEKLIKIKNNSSEKIENNNCNFCKKKFTKKYIFSIDIELNKKII